MRAKMFLSVIATAAALGLATLAPSYVRADDDDYDDDEELVDLRYLNGDDGETYEVADSAWRGGRVGLFRGRRGFTIGSGRFSIGIGPYRYSVGPYRYDESYVPSGSYSYSAEPRVTYPYETAYPSETYSSEIESSYDGAGVAIRNPSDAELSFTIDDRKPMRIAPGETVRLTEKGRFVISFDRGGELGSARYSIHEGSYEFLPTEVGWELYRAKADNAVADAPNPAVGLRAIEPARYEDLPPPRDNVDIEERRRDRRDERPLRDLPRDPPREDAELPPLPQGD
jgi:hypothetical protein